MNKEIKWQRKFENFEKAFQNLHVLVSYNKTYSDLEKEGIIQRFEILVELSWKVLKDFLIYQGFEEEKSPKSVIRRAYQSDIIQDVEQWMQSLDQRNRTSHTYNELILEEITNYTFGKFYPIVKDLYNYLKKEL